MKMGFWPVQSLILSASLTTLIVLVFLVTYFSVNILFHNISYPV